MVVTPGLRERKKLQTKQALIDSAYKLFAVQGYTKTSIEDIASSANFAPRTFFLHFDSKEDLLFPIDTFLVSSLQSALTDRDAGLTSLQALRLWIKFIVTQKESGSSPTSVLRRKIIDSDKSLQARQRLYLNTVEDTLTKAIAHDLQVDVDQVMPRIVATAALAIFGMIDERTGHELQAAETQHSINMAISFLEGGLGNLQTGKNRL